MKSSIKISHKSPKTERVPHPIPRTSCLYHKDQLITNFCKSPQCLMPLCPYCINIHTEEHNKSGTYGVYETIEEVWGSVLGELDRIEESFGKTRSRLQGLQHSNENAKAILLGRLGETKRRLVKIVEDFCRGIESEINEEHSMYTKEDLVGMEFTQQKIEDRLIELSKFRKKLTGNKFLKYLIVFISSAMVPENLTYNKEIDDYISQMDSRLPFLRDDLNSNTFFSFLNSYVSLENRKLHPKIPPRREFEPFPAENNRQHVHSQARFPDYEYQSQFVPQYELSGKKLNPQTVQYEIPERMPSPQKMMMGSPEKPRIFGPLVPNSSHLAEYNSPYSLDASGSKIQQSGIARGSPYRTVPNNREGIENSEGYYTGPRLY